MKVIGAGLPRTATTTQMFALEQLGLGPCYHMRDLLADLEAGPAAVGRRRRGRPRLGAHLRRGPLDGGLALGALLPRADGLLPRREGAAERPRRRGMGAQHAADRVGDLPRRLGLHHLCEARAVLDPLWRRYMTLMRHMTWDEETGALAGDTYTDAGLAAVMDRWNERSRARAGRAPARVEPARRLGAAVRVPRGRRSPPSRCRA